MVLISVIIPTYNEATTIREAAAALCELRGEKELIVTDGGSRDETMLIARAAGLRVIEAGRGRGPQMNAGARIAVGDVLLFLHADTR
ncbi:MAG: glycosyltransferase, partial [Blastocatellia bacterium]